MLLQKPEKLAKNYWKVFNLRNVNYPQENSRYIGKIPVRNIWLLMFYASNLYKHIDGKRIAVEENPDDIPDLIAEILTKIVERRLKRNLCHGYRKKDAELNRVRGRINTLETERKQLLFRGRVACSFYELSVDRPRNRFVRAALEELVKLVTTPELKSRCRSMASTFKYMGVIGEKPTRNEMSVDRIARHDTEDLQMVEAADLVFNLALPTERTGSRYLYQPNKEISWLRNLFEKAVAGFYDVILSDQGWKVEAGKKINWLIEEKTSGIDEIMPAMKTDIVLEHAASKRRIVIDTKFNSILTKGWYREQSLRSGYLYQIYTYLRSQENDDDPLSFNSTGLLLHPAAGSMVDESAVIQGHEIRFATVDLGGQAREIRKQLLYLVGASEKPGI